MTSEKQIIMVTGKGGVGKSTLAATVAYNESLKGRRTLLVEVVEESFYKPFFGLSQLSYEPQPISENLSVAIWDVEHCLREYVLHFLKIKGLYKVFFQNKIMRTFINAAPAISELAILGKVTSHHRRHGPPMPFDVIVVDAYATGHFLALLKAPKGLSEAVRTGPFGEQTASIMRTLLNPEVTEYLIVTLAENLPVVETQELWHELKRDFGIEAKIICNRLLNLPFSPSRLGELGRQHPSAAGLLEYFSYLKRREEASLEEIKKIPTSLRRVRQSLDYSHGLPLLKDLGADLL